MKKVLSLVLALALVVSCFTMIHVFAAQETVTGREFKWPSANYVHGSNGGWAVNELAEGTHMYNVTVYNTSAVDTKVNVYLQNGWGQMTKSVAFDTVAGSFRTIPAGGKSTLAVVVKVGADGKIDTVAQNDVCIRVDTDTANADKKVIVAYTGTEFDKLIQKATGTDVTEQEINVTETPVVEAAEWDSLSGYGITVDKSGDIFTAKNFTGSWTAPDFNIINQAKALVEGKTSYDIEVTYQANPNKDITVRPIIRGALNTIYCFGKDAPGLSTTDKEASSAAWMTWYAGRLGLANTKDASFQVTDGQNVYASNGNAGVKLTAGQWNEIKMHLTVRPEDFNIFSNMRVTFDNISVTDKSAIADLQIQLKAVTLSQYVAPQEDPGQQENPGQQTTYKKVTNGNAENGTTNWGLFKTAAGGCSIENVAGGANGTAHAIKFTPGGVYGSIAFDLGPAIIKDEANGYNGAGAGEYTVTYWAKAEAGKGGKFNFVLNSQQHAQPSNFTDAKNPLAALNVGDLAANTYITTAAALELTDQWQQFTSKVKVTEDFLKLLKIMYDGGFKDAYELIFRMDCAAAGKAFDNDAANLFSYFVDEIELTTPNGGNAENPNGEGKQEEVKVPTGISYKLTADTDGKTPVYIISKAGVITKKDVNGGVVTKSFKVTNTGSEDIKVAFELQATVTKSDGGKAWAGPHDYKYVLIEPGKTETIEFEMDVEDGKVEFTYSGEDFEMPIEQFFYRFDIKSGDNQSALAKGTAFTIACTGAEYDIIFASPITNAANFEVETVYGKNGSSGTGDILPVALIATVALSAVALVVVAKKKKENEAA